jgi:AraC-like DNA-binding protein
MITTSEMQYGGMLTTGLLALTIALQLPRRAARDSVYGRARWWMVGGLALLSVQFLLQYLFNFRQMGVTQAVYVNLMMFMPCSAMISMAILCMQRYGRTKRGDWLVSCAIYALAAAVLTLTALADGVPFAHESAALRAAEYVGAALYAALQFYYFYQHWTAYQQMRHAVDVYYDRERSDLLGWMGRSVVMLAVLTLAVPFVIFAEGWMLTVYGSLFFFTIYYCASCFHSYGISLDTQRVEEARRSFESDEAVDFTLSADDRHRVEEAAAQWTATGGYCQRDLTLTTVAAAMDVPRYMLKEWLQASDDHKLSNWLNRLRTDEACRMMTEHPEWSLDAVADHCGFSRSSFHRIFYSLKGVTPGRFVSRLSN